MIQASRTDGVVIAVATTEANPDERRVIVRTIAPKDWKRWAWGAASTATGYLEVGRYADDSTAVVPVASTQPPWRQGRADREMRYM